MSDTPRTDAAMFPSASREDQPVVHAEFARSLERELNMNVNRYSYTANNRIAEYDSPDGRVEFHGTAGGITVFVGERMVQKDLNMREFACYMAHCLQAAHHKRSSGPHWTPSTTLPPHNELVIVQGGVGYWDGVKKAWFTVTGEAWPGREIAWEVKEWMPIPSPTATRSEG